MCRQQNIRIIATSGYVLSMGMLLPWWTAFLLDEVILEVPYRQLVFVIPKRFRSFFQRDRVMYGVL